MRTYVCEPVCVRECACVCLHPFNMSVWRMWTDVLPQYLPSVVSELLQLFLEVGEVLWQDGQQLRTGNLSLCSLVVAAVSSIL